MPGIFRVTCEACDFERTDSASVTMVILADGSEAICPHPGERLTAEEKTGESWRELVSAGRIAYRYSAICGHCGELDYYEVGGRVGHIRSITHQPTAAELADTCASCGQAQLHPVADRRMEDVLCPHCGDGNLRSKLIAVS